MKEDYFKALEEFALRKVYELADRLANGDIAASPVQTGKGRQAKIPCSYCDYFSVCGNANPKNPRIITDEDKEKYKTIKEISLIPGEDVDIPKVKDKGNFKYMRFDPDPENMDKSGNTYATYSKNVDDGKEPEKFQVMFIVLKDPADVKSEDIIVKVNGLEVQEVEKGKRAIKPAIKDIPKVDGYDFVDWGEAEEKLKNVTEDIIAVGHYRKHIAVLAMPFAYYQDVGDGGDLDLGNSDDGDDNGSSNNAGGNDLYVFPIASSKDFESAPEAGND